MVILLIVNILVVFFLFFELLLLLFLCVMILDLRCILGNKSVIMDSFVLICFNLLCDEVLGIWFFIVSGKRWLCLKIFYVIVYI